MEMEEAMSITFRSARYAFVMIIVSHFSACTYLNAEKVSTADDKDIKGLIYYLPKSEFDIVLTRTLQSCALKTDPNFKTEGNVVSINGTTVTGDEKSNFSTEFAAGDWMLIGHQARRVETVNSDIEIITKTQFTLRLREPLPY
jgi:hypothetical protein